MLIVKMFRARAGLFPASLLGVLLLAGVFLAALGDGWYDLLGALLMLPNCLVLIWYCTQPFWQGNKQTQRNPEKL